MKIVSFTILFAANHRVLTPKSSELHTHTRRKDSCFIFSHNVIFPQNILISNMENDSFINYPSCLYMTILLICPGRVRLSWTKFQFLFFSDIFLKKLYFIVLHIKVSVLIVYFLLSIFLIFPMILYQPKLASQNMYSCF